MTTTPTIWQRRWQSIDSTLGVIQDRYAEFAREDSSRRGHTIYTLLQQLKHFGRDQFHFFHDGFITKRFVELAPVPDARDFKYPAYITGHSLDDHVLRTTMDQMAEDVVVIQRASEQRDISIKLAAEGLPGRANIFGTLNQVDWLALTALQMVGVYLQGQAQTALTYFRRSTNVRVIPYAPVALIGIPLTAVGLNSGIGVAEDLLAIPHETAHHLYWNGRVDNMPIHRRLQELAADSPVAHWAEEIFADVVGCLIGGPAVARSFIDLQRVALGNQFHADHDPHPTAALRPLIYAYTLEQMGLADRAAEVRSVWQGELQQRTSFVDRSNLYAAFDMVDAVLTVVQPGQLLQELRWTLDVPYAQLYAHFQERIDQITAAINHHQLDPPDFGALTDWRELAAHVADQAAFSTLPDDWVTRLVDDLPGDGAPLTVDAEDWLEVFDFGGWTTEGPTGRAH